MNKPETITADELAYHQQVLGQLKRAQAVLESWSVHLTNKYKLNPQDKITEEGLIERVVLADKAKS